MARNIVYDKGGVLSTIDGLLKEDYVLKEIQDTVNKSTVLLNRIKTEKSTHGRRFVFPSQLAVAQGNGTRAELADLPDPGFGEYEQAFGNVKYLYGRFLITGQSIESTRDSKAAFADALKQALKDTREGFKLDNQRQTWGQENGTIGLVNGPVTADVTVPVDSPYGLTYAETLDGSQNVRLFKRHMQVLFNGGNPRTIVGVNPSAGTITVDTAVTLADNAVIARGSATGSSVGTDINGLTGAIANAGTYLGIDRTGRPEWQSNMVDCNGPLSEEAMRIAKDTGEINGNAAPDLAITDYVTRRRYESLLTSLKRFVNPMKLEGGYSAIEYDGMPLVVDKDAPPERIWFLHTPDIIWFSMKDIGWMDRDGAVLSRIVNKDAYEATLLNYKELAVKRPANQTVLFGIEAFDDTP